jgi:Tol biopolymer transport system component
LAPKVLSYVRFSPDGKSMAMTIGAARGTNRHTAIYEFSTGTLTRITPDGGAHSPVWSPDGKRMAYTAENTTTDAEDIFVQPIDRSSPPVAILSMPSDQHASAWPNDTTLVFSNNNAARTLGGTLNGGSADLVNPVTKAKPKPLLHAAWGESDAAISPDGQWMAFTSTESGTPEIHVRAFPDGASRGDWKISTGGGQKARWSADGRTIYYQNADATAIRSTRVTPGSPFGIGATETIMQGKPLGVAWDFDRATGRIAVTETVLDASLRIIVMQHWLDAFKRKVAATP